MGCLLKAMPQSQTLTKESLNDLQNGRQPTLNQAKLSKHKQFKTHNMGQFYDKYSLQRRTFGENE